MATTEVPIALSFDPDKRVAAYIADYKAQMKATGANILGLAELFSRVEDELGQAYKRVFYAGIGVDGKSSWARKYRVIGDKAQKFRPHVDKMPPNWTFWYDMTRLKDEEFNRVVNSGLLAPSMTSKEMREIALEKREQKEKPLRVTLNCKEARDKKGLVEALRNLAATYNVDLTDDPRNKEAIKQMLEPQASEPERSAAA